MPLETVRVLLEAGAEIGEVSLIGGGSRSRLWGQILASVLNRPLNIPNFPGLAMLAAEQGSLEQICTRPKISEVLEPQPSLVMHYQEKQEQYRKIYRSLERLLLVGLFKGGLCFKHFFLEWSDFFPSRRKNILIVFLIVLHPFRLRADFLGIHFDLGKGVIKVLI